MIHQTRVGGGFRAAADERLYAGGRGHRAQGQCAGQAAMDAGRRFQPRFLTAPPAITSSRAPSTRMASSTPGRSISSPSPPTARSRSSGGDHTDNLKYLHQGAQSAPRQHHDAADDPHGAVARAGRQCPGLRPAKLHARTVAGRRARSCAVPAGCGEPRRAGTGAEGPRTSISVPRGPAA